MSQSRRLERLFAASEDADLETPAFDDAEQLPFSVDDAGQFPFSVDDSGTVGPVAWDAYEAELPPGERWTTFDRPGVQLGPKPWPAWLVTTGAAHDVDLGVLKTGKEADVVLVHRFDAAAECLLAAKRYRSREHRQFTRDNGYTQGRRVRKSREMRAMRTKTDFGRQLQAGLWARTEWSTLVELWIAGFPVPYPVSYDGDELMMEFVGDGDGVGATRLAPLRPDVELLASLYEQARDVILRLAARGQAHGDLSPYNCLVDDGRLVVIDWPQIVDVVSNPDGVAYLQRDVDVMSAWFSARGLDVDAGELLAEALASL